MGKDIILDSGKKAQGSMARYWKQQKQREKQKHKHPTTHSSNQDKQKQEEVDQSTANYDKWKVHQQNMIMKKYNRQDRQAGDTNPIQAQSEVQKPVVESHEAILKQVDQKEAVIPGYTSKSQIHKKIHKTTVLKSTQAPSSNKEVPPQLQGLFSSPEQLQRILQKNKQKNIEKLKNQKKKMESKAKQRAEDPFEKTLQDERYNPMKPDMQEEQSEPQQAQPAQKEFFKSDLLNQIASGIQPNLKPEPAQQQKSQPEPVVQTQPKAYRFIPRSVLLKTQNP